MLKTIEESSINPYDRINPIHKLVGNTVDVVDGNKGKSKTKDGFPYDVSYILINNISDLTNNENAINITNKILKEFKDKNIIITQDK